jgi:anti-sigma regulatory factor (Ser/Thr protein kinase)
MKKVQYKASLDNLYEMLAQVRRASEQAAFPPSLISRIELALEEALVNIIRYAYPEQEELGWIDIECKQPVMGGIAIIVRDGGVPYNPLSYVPQINPSEGIDNMPDGVGYGIFFITHLMDEVNYKRENNENVLTLSMNKPKS